MAQCAGLLSEAACQAAHAILAHRAQWVTNEQQLLTRAGLRGVDAVVAQLGTEPDGLVRAADAVRALVRDAVRAEGIETD